MPSCIQPRRCNKGRKPATGRICTRFVTSDGKSSKAAACAGGMNTASKAMETVGRPRPTTPLTQPASPNTAMAAAAIQPSFHIINPSYHPNL
jgi:hypothetical protein